MNILLDNAIGVKEYTDNKHDLFSDVTWATNALNRSFITGRPVYEDLNHPGAVYVIEYKRGEAFFIKEKNKEGAYLRKIKPRDLLMEPSYYAKCVPIYYVYPNRE